MATAATSTSALSSLEAMLFSLMRGSDEGGGGGGEENSPVDDDTLASPPPPPLPARPTPQGRHPSRYTVNRAAGSWTTSSPSPPPVASPSKDDASSSSDDTLLAELERKAVEVEAQLRQKEEENAALKRRIESYHFMWLKYEIKIKSLEEACQEQKAALQMVQDAAARADEMARDRRDSLESQMKMSEDPSARLRHGRDRVVAGARRSSVSRLSSEFRRQSQALDHGAAALVVAEPPRQWQPAAPSADSVDDLRKLKAQFRAWKKDYKARLRMAKAELDRDRRHRVGCWI
ncbi:hypothetical protein EJB05_24414, partial [Eragrostis curvula]